MATATTACEEVGAGKEAEDVAAGTEVGDVDTASSEGGAICRFYAIRKSAQDSPAPLRNAVFISWDDCSPFMGTAVSASEGYAQNDPVESDMKGGDKEAKEVSNTGERRAEFGIFDTVDKALEYLTEGLEEAEWSTMTSATRKRKIVKTSPEEEFDSDKGAGGDDVERGEGDDVSVGRSDTAPGQLVSAGSLEESMLTPPEKKRGRGRPKLSDSSPSSVTPKGKTRKPRKTSVQWLAMLERLRIYKEEHGTSDVRIDSKDDLYRWVWEQRQQFKNSIEGGTKRTTLNEEKIRLLQELDFSFAPTTPKKLSEKGSSEKVLVRSSHTPLEYASSPTTPQGKSRKPRKIHAKWLAMYERLSQYKKENGTSDVRMDSKDDLYRWVFDQRQQFKAFTEGGPKRTALNEEKIRLLRELAFSFTPSGKGWGRSITEKWMEKFDRCRAFLQEHGTLDVLEKDKNLDPELLAWVRGQRHQYRLRNDKSLKDTDRRPMSDEKARRLEEIGFTFSNSRNEAREREWDEHFEELKRFKDEHGHTNVPLSEKGKPKTRFQNWVVSQRVNYRELRLGKSKRMTFEQLTRLNSVGFQFVTRTRYVPWEERMEQAKVFIAEHGHFNVPTEHPVLGKFTCEMRRYYKNHLEGTGPNSLNEERIQQLNALGFVWQVGKRLAKNMRPKKSWEERFQDLLEYREMHGHTNVPRSHPDLGLFVKSQRRLYKRMIRGQSSTMTAQRALKLSEIGFVFEMRNRSTPPTIGAKIEEEEHRDQGYYM